MGFFSDIFSGFEDELKSFGRKFDDYFFHGGLKTTFFMEGLKTNLGVAYVG